MYHCPDHVVLKVDGLTHHPPSVVSQGVENSHRVSRTLQSLPHVAGNTGNVTLDVGGEGAKDDRALSSGALHQDELGPALVPDILTVMSAQLLAGLGVFLVSIVIIFEATKSLWISACSLY